MVLVLALRLSAVLFCIISLRAATLASIAIDYPAEGSIFPPEITAPTFLWRDSANATVWHIDISFTDGSPSIHRTAKGAHLQVGEIDPDCVADTNEPPVLTPQQAASRTWIPNAAAWAHIKRHSAAGPATIVIAGYRAGHPISRGRVTIRTSRDPAGAPIFYRDVPLMPSELEKGVIKPLTAAAMPLVKWRVRDIGEPGSRVVMDNLPVCANCHSFSRDGKTMGMDLDGLKNNKGLYSLTPVAPEMSMRDENLVQWRSPKGKLKGSIRVGFMSQVSPDGQYVVTTINPQESPSNYYVANFKDYRFLQVFYPTRGILAWYSRANGVLQPLPGADDPHYVQFGATWSPDGRYLVFARADAKDPDPAGAPMAQFANDPNELQIQYDLYRIPFNNGRGGVAEPIAGASHNGMSNSFPKVSPDGRWIVFVKCRNGQLMRPDSELYIVPAAGGVARRLRANTARMNSWHSFSPNGRWLVFSSKSRSPYTQMYLTHIDEDGNDSPAILIDNATAANRAVNLPEFVNIPPGGLQRIGGPAIDYYRLVNSAVYLQKRKAYEESAAKWRQVLALRPDDEMAHRNLGLVLLLSGRGDEAAVHIRKATELGLREKLETEPGNAAAHNELGVILLEAGRTAEAIAEFQAAPDLAAARANLGRALAAAGRLDDASVQLQRAMQLDPRHAPAYYYFGTVLSKRGETDGAIDQWQHALALDPGLAEAHDALAAAFYSRGRAADALAHWRKAAELRPNDVGALRHAAWVMATSSDFSIRSGADAVAFAVHALQISGGKDPTVLDTLAAAYAEKAQYADAVLTARRALALAPASSRNAIQTRIALYESGSPFRE